jgi:2-methylcitrate dehydratase PrpD
MDIMFTLVENFLNTKFEDLPNTAVAAAKKSILDTMGATIAGSSVKGCHLLREHIIELGGKAESSIAAFGDRVPCNLAGFVNGTMARALEIADVFDRFPLHPSASIVPACLAIAEKKGNVSGKEFITAVALGHDMKIRMALATKIGPIQSGRYNLFKIFPAVGAVGRLWGLDQDKLSNAMGIAFTHMVGDAQSAFEGAMTHYLQQGMVAKLAIEDVLLAEKGITGAKNVLQGRNGFYKAYEPGPNLDALTYNLGKEFRGCEISIKFYSACRASHESIDLARSMVSTEKITPEQIESISIRVNKSVYDLNCSPLVEKHHPKTAVDAQFSIPFTVAASIVRGDFFVDELNEEILKDERILDLARRVTPVVDESCNTDLVIGAAEMEIKLRNGRIITGKTRFPKGNPSNPATMEECIRKFEKCIKYSVREFSQSQTADIAGCVSRLEELSDVTELAHMLVPR